MYNSLFDLIFGRPSLSDSLFRSESKTAKFVGNEDTEVSDDKYVFDFYLGDDIDADCLKVSVKDDTLKVTYKKETENSLVNYCYTRSIPEDANTDDIKAELSDKGNSLQVTVARKAIEAEKKVKEIPISIED
jgi:HSP20 family molecular chaperone IbpA